MNMNSFELETIVEMAKFNKNIKPILEKLDKNEPDYIDKVKGIKALMRNDIDPTPLLAENPTGGEIRQQARKLLIDDGDISKLSILEIFAIDEGIPYKCFKDLKIPENEFKEMIRAYLNGVNLFEYYNKMEYCSDSYIRQITNAVKKGIDVLPYISHLDEIHLDLVIHALENDIYPEPLAKMEFTDQQIMALSDLIVTGNYNQNMANVNYKPDLIRGIALGNAYGVDILKYIDHIQNYSYKEINVLVDCLLAGFDVNRLLAEGYRIGQIQIINKYKSKGIDLTPYINPKYRITTLELCGHALSKGVNINYISPDNKPAIAKVVNGLYPKLNNEFDPYQYTDGQINSIINGTLADVNMSWITPKISAMDMSTINMYLEKYPQLNKLDLQNIKPELLKLTIEFLTIGVNITEYTTKDTTIYELTTIGNALAEGVNLDMLKVENR